MKKRDSGAGIGTGGQYDDPGYPVKAYKMMEKKETFETQKRKYARFKIPKKPSGKTIKITIFTTWGDQYYVGLAGVELFDGQGNAIKVLDPKHQLKADPPDINILPGYGNDPRTVDKLMNGVYLTCDDFHQWLAPFNQ